MATLLTANIIDAVGKLKSRPKSLENFLKKKKNQELSVVSVKVCRVPVQKMVKSFLNLITGGKVEEVQKKYDYDDIFHLFSVITFSNGDKYMFEKNEVVNFKKFKESMIKKGSECTTETKIRGNKNFLKVIEGLEKKDKNFYIYDAKNKNCQFFVKDVVNALGIKKHDNFIMQYGARDILGSKSVKTLSKSLTTFAAVLKRASGQD